MLLLGILCSCISLIGARTTVQVPGQVSSASPIQVPSTTCPHHVISDNIFQECVSILGNLNTTALKRDDKCSYYAESVYCTQRAASASGGACTVADIQYWYHKIAASFVDFGEMNHCVVKPEAGDLCTSEDRLASFALTSCRPYLESMPSTQCMLVNYLLNCVNTYIGYMHKSCTDLQVQTALGSSSGSAWLHRHYPALDLSSCFNAQVQSSPPTQPITTIPQGTKACVDVYDMLANHAIIGCLYYLQLVNLTGSNAIPVKDGCSLINEALTCMRRVMHVSGSSCTMQQMHDTLAGILHVTDMLGPNKGEYVTLCAVDISYGTTSICTDTHRLVTFLAYRLNSYFELVDNVSPGVACPILENSIADKFSENQITCTSGEVWSALTSSEGMAKLSAIAPKFDPHSCMASSTTNTAPITKQA